MRPLLCGLLATLLLAGCPTREFYLKHADVDWDGLALHRVAVPAFEAPPDAWVIADAAHRALAEALGRGTVQVVEGPSEAILHGAIAGFHESANPGSPRRVTASGLNGMPVNAFIWEADVTHAVQFRLVLRLETSAGTVVFSRETPGTASESATVPLDWPGNDPVLPANLPPVRPDPTVLQRLRQRALDQAVAPMVEAVTVHYAYRSLH